MAEKKPFSIVLCYTYGTVKEQEISCTGHSLHEVMEQYSHHVEELKSSRVFRWKSAMLYTPTGSHCLAHPDNVAMRTKADRLPKGCQVIHLTVGQAIPETLHTLTRGSVSLSPAGYPLVDGVRVFQRTDKVGKTCLIWQGITCKVYARKSGKKTYEIHIKRPQEIAPACNKSGWAAQVGAEVIKTKRQYKDREKRQTCLAKA